MTARANAVFLCGAVLSVSGVAIAQTQERNTSQANSAPQVSLHFSRGRLDSGKGDTQAIARETAEALAGNIKEPVMMPTRSTFLAKWQKVKGATGYRLDVSTSPSFDNYVGNYRNVDLGNVSFHVVRGLNHGTKYYYRVRAYSAAGTGNSSEVTSVMTANINSGLVIIPDFDGTITNDPRSNAIQAMVISAIQICQTLFADPITVPIRFRLSAFRPDGTPLDTLVGASNTSSLLRDWNEYVAALVADGQTTNDAIANATLPPAPITAKIDTKTAGGRAIGLDTPPGMFADGSVGAGGLYDGIITLNSDKPLQFTRPASPGNFDAQTFTEHEIDEVLGLGSHIDSPAPQFLSPQDLFIWSSPGVRNTDSTGVRYFSIDSGNHNIVNLNQDPGGDFGDWLSDDFCPAVHFFVQDAFNCAGQSADITATSPEGVNLDVIGYDLIPAIPPPPASGTLGNISTRLPVLTGDNLLIAGFVIAGSTAKQLVLRAIGPTLAQFGLTNTLPDPTLDLHDSNGTRIAFNDDWQDASNAQSIPPSLQPTNGFESALLVTLNPGAYTAIVRGFDNSVGIALVEVYDLGGGSAQLTNISTRGFVQTGDNVMIAGVIVQSQNKQVVIRAIGPSLTGLGVPNALPDPTLDVHDANGTRIAFNDDWRDDQESIIAGTGLAPSNNFESAIAGTVAPGSYTAIVRGFNNAIGNALVEVFTLD
jgi:hypothetical protein